MDSSEKITEFFAIGREVKGNNEDPHSQAYMSRSERLSTISELSTSVAHQISNPLTTIIADAQILLHFLEKEHPGRVSAEAIYQAGWQAQKVIQVLRDLSQSRLNQNEIVSINETIENALLLTSAYMLETSMKIIKNLYADLPVVYGNSQDLTDVWINLLLMAHAAAETGQINQVEITTTDISPEWIEVKFNYNGEIVIHDPRDTSLISGIEPHSSLQGLEENMDICHEIINLHEGFIQVETPWSCYYFTSASPERIERKWTPN